MAERLSKGGRANLRKKLAEARRTDDPRRIQAVEKEVSNKRTALIPETAGRALSEVEKLLVQDNLPHHEIAAKGLERIWLRFALGVTTSTTRKEEYLTFLDKIEQENPVGLSYLLDIVGNDPVTGDPINRLAETRDRINKKFPRRG